MWAGLLTASYSSFPMQGTLVSSLASAPRPTTREDMCLQGGAGSGGPSGHVSGKCNSFLFSHLGGQNDAGLNPKALSCRGGNRLCLSPPALRSGAPVLGSSVPGSPHLTCHSVEFRSPPSLRAAVSVRAELTTVNAQKGKLSWLLEGQLFLCGSAVASSHHPTAFRVC